MKESFIHMIGGCVVIACSCGGDVSHEIEGESGTDEMEYDVRCSGCGKKHTVRMSAELVEEAEE